MEGCSCKVLAFRVFLNIFWRFVLPLRSPLKTKIVKVFNGLTNLNYKHFFKIGVTEKNKKSRKRLFRTLLSPTFFCETKKMFGLIFRMGDLFWINSAYIFSIIRKNLNITHSVKQKKLYTYSIWHSSMDKKFYLAIDCFRFLISRTLL